jgi:hypothetical protein
MFQGEHKRTYLQRPYGGGDYDWRPICSRFIGAITSFFCGTPRCVRGRRVVCPTVKLSKHYFRQSALSFLMRELSHSDPYYQRHHPVSYTVRHIMLRSRKAAARNLMIARSIAFRPEQSAKLHTTITKATRPLWSTHDEREPQNKITIARRSH